MSNLMRAVELRFKSRVVDTEWLATQVPSKLDSATTSLAKARSHHNKVQAS